MQLTSEHCQYMMYIYKSTSSMIYDHKMRYLNRREKMMSAIEMKAFCDSLLYIVTTVTNVYLDNIIPSRMLKFTCKETLVTSAT